MHLFRMTGQIQVHGPEAYTQLYVMRSHIVDDTMPADAVVDERTANVIVDAIVSESKN